MFTLDIGGTENTENIVIKYIDITQTTTTSNWRTINVIRSESKHCIKWLIDK